MAVTNWERQDNNLLLTMTDGRIKLEVLTASIIHVVYTRRDTFSAKPSWMVLPQELSTAQWSVADESDSLILSTDQIRLEINKKSSAFTWRDSAGQLLVKEPANGGKILGEVPVERTVFTADTKIKTEEGVDGARTRLEGGKKVVDRKAYYTKLELEFSAGEAIYGLGSHEEGIMNYRGHSQLLYQQNQKVVAPIMVSTRGYSLVFDTYSLAGFHDDQYGSYFWTEVDDEMDFYFIYGPEFDSIVAAIRRLTGEVPMLPRWAYGYVQSKERYKTQDELVEVVQEYRRRGIPLDCIVQDWMTWPGDKWGQKCFDTERYPAPDQLVADLHALHAKLMVSIWPHMRNNGDNQQEMREHGYLLGNDSTYDAYNPAARDLYWQQAKDGYFKHGIDAWWCDCTEPFEADWRGSVKPEPWQRLKINVGEFQKYIDPEVINAYSLLHTQGIYEGQRAVTDAKRVVNLTRSSFPGQQRYGAITWSGDIDATWQVLRRQIPEGLNFAVTGNPRWTLDIGAFFVGHRDLWFWHGDYNEGCNDLGYRELYVRWFQYGAFLPMFRSHGTETPREVWRFGEQGETTYDTLVRFDYLRYRLLPYLYSVAAWETRHAYTSMRSLAFDFRHDPAVYDIDDQYMFGPALLVCPVTKPMYYGPESQALEGVEKTRQVYLPAGCDWYDFWTGERYQGGQTITTAAPLEIMPLFVKAGTILPMGPRIQHTEEGIDAPWEVRIYPGANGSFEIYEDEGDGYGYEEGHFATLELCWDDEAGRLDIGTRKGEFPGMVQKREFRIVFVGTGHGAGDLPVDAPDQVVSYTGAPVAVVKR